MDWPTNYVYVPMWFLMLLLFLSSGCLQYALVAAVRWVIRSDREKATRAAETQPPATAKILRLDDLRAEERRASSGKEQSGS